MQRHTARNSYYFVCKTQSLKLGTVLHTIFVPVCGDGSCDKDQREDCSTCPKDCGKCPLQAHEIALIVIFICLIAIAGVIVVIVRLCWRNLFIGLEYVNLLQHSQSGFLSLRLKLSLTVFYGTFSGIISVFPVPETKITLGWKLDHSVWKCPWRYDNIMHEGVICPWRCDDIVQ